MTDVDLNDLYDNRSDPDVRMVLEDWERTMGRSPTRLAYALSFIHADADADADDAAAAAAAAAADDAAAAADDAADAADTAADDAAAAADAAADDAAAADDDADDAADAAAAAGAKRFLKQCGDQDMRNGLKVIVLHGAYYNYGVTKIAWIRRVNGDEYEILPGAITILRTGDKGNLEDLAVEGLGKRYKIHGKASRTTEPFHRFGPRRIIDADEKAWAEHCPRPKEWSE